jgi:hypothetical protein
VIFEAGSTISTIGPGAFGECRSLLAIFIPASVQLIDLYCFGSCVSLHDVTFEMGSRLSEIGAVAFRHCVSLASIRVPASVRSIGDQAFSDCTALVNFTFESGCRAKWGRQWLYRCPRLRPYYEDCWLLANLRSMAPTVGWIMVEIIILLIIQTMIP